jgi:hypothetical protein
MVAELRRITPAVVRETFLKGRPKTKDETTWLNDVTKHAGGTAGEKTFTDAHKTSMAKFYLKGEWWSAQVEEWRSGGVEEWRSGGVEEWRSGGVEEWKGGGVEELRSGGVEEWRSA